MAAGDVHRIRGFFVGFSPSAMREGMRPDRIGYGAQCDFCGAKAEVSIRPGWAQDVKGTPELDEVTTQEIRYIRRWVTHLVAARCAKRREPEVNCRVSEAIEYGPDMAVDLAAD
jgi:hypothetical protein